MNNLIIICGFMGSGKSTFGARLAKSSASYNGIDLDKEINQRHNTTKKKFGDWISSIGIDQFRELESQVLQNLVEEYADNKVILSLGGGALSNNNQKFLKQKKAFLVWINTPFEVCFERIKSDSNRPLVSKGKEFLKKIYNERVEIYKECNLVLSPVEQDQIFCADELFELQLDEASFPKA